MDADRTRSSRRRLGRATLPILVPIAFGIAFFFLGVVLPDPIQGQVALGAIGALVAVIIELILRLARSEERRDMISQLLRDLDNLPADAYPMARRLVAAYAHAVGSTDHPVYRDALRAQAQQSATWLERVSDGELEVRAENIGLLEEGVQTCRNTIRGITIASQDLDWWQSQAGRRYWAENIAAMKTRDVTVDRIFIDGTGFPDTRFSELLQLMAEQAADNVNVFLIRLGKVAEFNDAERDITVFDDQLVHEVTRWSHGIPTHVTYRRGRDAVRQANAHFEKVLIRAKPYVP